VTRFNSAGSTRLSFFIKPSLQERKPPLIRSSEFTASANASLTCAATPGLRLHSTQISAETIMDCGGRNCGMAHPNGR
jgi:hypothetical protein